MITRGLREFVDRDWAAVRAEKDRYWSERVAALGPMEAFRIADELRRQVLMSGNWPTPEDRRADLEAHIRFSTLLRRACSTRRA